MQSADVSIAEELAAFEEGRIDPKQFPHAEHVRLAFEMVRRCSFGETVARFSSGLKQLAAASGKPEVYHETITVGFLALINERRVRGNDSDWRQFIERNQDLLQKSCLESHYDRSQLETDLARTTFCLPAARRVL
jgi:hypothetical protein